MPVVFRKVTRKVGGAPRLGVDGSTRMNVAYTPGGAELVGVDGTRVGARGEAATELPEVVVNVEVKVEPNGRGEAAGVSRPTEDPEVGDACALAVDAATETVTSARSLAAPEVLKARTESV